MGEVEGVDPFAGPHMVPDYRYYYDKIFKVVFSVEPQDMKTGIEYFFDPELTRRVP